MCKKAKQIFLLKKTKKAYGACQECYFNKDNKVHCAENPDKPFNKCKPGFYFKLLK